MISPIIDEIGAFLHSDGWRLIKYRLRAIYKQTLQEKINSNIRANDNARAQLYLGMMEGVDEAINITERIIGELSSGKFDADVALSVIENKQRTK